MLDILAAPDSNDYAPSLEHDAALDCILKAAIVSTKTGKPWSAKCVLPTETGYIVRSDFLESADLPGPGSSVKSRVPMTWFSD
ncbi:hypothetical protein G7054_g6757 [Neopestalotiopsis clavispora]|nr:hypothetical protein G7054_g6757 [Neopestalotiopsis clavispora]